MNLMLPQNKIGTNFQSKIMTQIRLPPCNKKKLPGQSGSHNLNPPETENTKKTATTVTKMMITPTKYNIFRS